MGRGKGRGGGGRGREKQAPRVCEEEEEYLRQLGGQDPRAGRMPSDSESSDSDEGNRIGPIEQDNVFSRNRGRGQASNVGMLPPSDSDSDSSDGREVEIKPHRTQAEEPRRSRKDAEEEGPDEEQMAKDMDRLKLIREKRETERQARIAREGWDRFAPVTEANKPPTGAGRPADE